MPSMIAAFGALGDTAHAHSSEKIMEWLSGDRRGFMRLAGAAALAAAAAPARAAWPDRTIRVVVSSAPGDGVDLRTRDFLASLAPELGNPTMFVDTSSAPRIARCCFGSSAGATRWSRISGRA